MLEGRVNYKKKLGMEEISNGNPDDAVCKQKYKVKQIKWENKKGDLYAILYDKKLDIMTANSENALNTVTSDNNFICFDYLTPTALIIGDDRGVFSLCTKIDEEDKMSLKLLNTKCSKFRDIRAGAT